MSKFPNVSDLLGLKFKFREPGHENVGLEGIIIGEYGPTTAVMAITKGNAKHGWNIKSSRDLDIIPTKYIKKYAAYKCLLVPMRCIGEHVDDDFSDEGECTMIEKNTEFKIGDKVAFKYDMLDEDEEEAEGIIILMLENSLVLINVTGGNTSGAWYLDESIAADDYDITPEFFKKYKGSLCCYKVTDVLTKLEPKGFQVGDKVGFTDSNGLHPCEGIIVSMIPKQHRSIVSITKGDACMAWPLNAHTAAHEEISDEMYDKYKGSLCYCKSICNLVYLGDDAAVTAAVSDAKDAADAIDTTAVPYIPKVGDMVVIGDDEALGAMATGIVISEQRRGLVIVSPIDHTASNYGWILTKETDDKEIISREVFKKYEGTYVIFENVESLKKLVGPNCLEANDEEVDLRAVEPDNVNYFDAHYFSEHQPIETMQSNMSPEAFKGFLRGNIIKYACRLGRKDDDHVEATKIKRYAKWLLDAVDGKTIDPRKG